MGRRPYDYDQRDPDLPLELRPRIIERDRLTIHNGYALSPLGIDWCDFCGSDVAGAPICARCGCVQDDSPYEPPRQR